MTHHAPMRLTLFSEKKKCLFSGTCKNSKPFHKQQQNASSVHANGNRYSSMYCTNTFVSVADCVGVFLCVRVGVYLLCLMRSFQTFCYSVIALFTDFTNSYTPCNNLLDAVHMVLLQV